MLQTPTDSTRIYRVSIWRRVLYLLLGLVMCAFSITGLVIFLSGLTSRPRLDAGDALKFLLVFLFCAILAAIFLLLTFRIKLILRDDLIESVSYLSSRIIKKDDVISQRTTSTKNNNVLWLGLKSGQEVGIMLIFKTDRAFDKWLETIPDYKGGALHLNDCL